MQSGDVKILVNPTNQRFITADTKERWNHIKSATPLPVELQTVICDFLIDPWGPATFPISVWRYEDYFGGEFTLEQDGTFHFNIRNDQKTGSWALTAVHDTQDTEAFAVTCPDTPKDEANCSAMRSSEYADIGNRPFLAYDLTLRWDNADDKTEPAGIILSFDDGKYQTFGCVAGLGWYDSEEDTPDYCLAPTCEILMADGTYQAAQSLAVGDLVVTNLHKAGPPQVERIEATVMNRLNRCVDMVQLAPAVLITPGHPSLLPRDKSSPVHPTQWSRAGEIARPQSVFMPAVYNFVTEQRGPLLLRATCLAGIDDQDDHPTDAGLENPADVAALATQLHGHVVVSTLGAFCPGVDDRPAATRCPDSAHTSSMNFFGSDQVIQALRSRVDWPHIVTVGRRV